jgi:hypothetical protein
MKIDPHWVPVREVVSGYVNTEEDGVSGLDGRLNIRPKFQRLFRYNIEQQQAVIRTILQGFPLNVFYWSVSGDSDGEPTYEMLDGQQRTLSICEFVEGNFSITDPSWPFPKNFDSLSTDDRNKVYDYPLMVYKCRGTEDEKLAWFKVINIAGLKLEAQELRNAVYTGPWLTDAKRYFSRENQAAHKYGKDYVKPGDVKAQALLEKALVWIAGRGDAAISGYMNDHRQDQNALELWKRFRDVVDWAKTTFPKVRPQLRQVNWPDLYDRFGSGTWNPVELEQEVNKLLADFDVTNKAGVYEFVLSGDERVLNIRAFDPAMRTEAYEGQGGICPRCGKHWEIDEMEADHITPWSQGGKTNAANCQMLCREDNRRKGAI